jgi:hypothetical protein
VDVREFLKAKGEEEEQQTRFDIKRCYVRTISPSRKTPTPDIPILKQAKAEYAKLQ